MKELYLIFLTIYLTTTLAHYEKHNCGINQIYVTCGSGCEPSCKNPKPQTCKQQCVNGCRCMTGYVRNDKNECVKQCNVNYSQSPPPPVLASPQPRPVIVAPPPPPPPVLAPPRPQPVIVAAPPPPPPPPKPANCWDLLCPQGMMCSMVQEKCQRRPCPPPVPKCVMGAPPVTTTTPRPVTPVPAKCSDLICPKGYTCGKVNTCERTPCAAPQIQCMAPSTPPPPQLTKPKSCSMVRCATGMVCEMVQDPCKRAPCPSPLPKCVPARSPPPSCSNTHCATGTHCEMKAPKCSHSPCQPPVPQCVQNHVAPPPPPPRPQPIVVPVLMAEPYPHVGRPLKHKHHGRHRK